MEAGGDTEQRCLPAGWGCLCCETERGKAMEKREVQTVTVAGASLAAASGPFCHPPTHSSSGRYLSLCLHESCSSGSASEACAEPGPRNETKQRMGITRKRQERLEPVCSRASPPLGDIPSEGAASVCSLPCLFPCLLGTFPLLLPSLSWLFPLTLCPSWGEAAPANPAWGRQEPALTSAAQARSRKGPEQCREGRQRLRWEPMVFH